MIKELSDFVHRHDLEVPVGVGIFIICIAIAFRIVVGGITYSPSTNKSDVKTQDQVQRVREELQENHLSEAE